MGATGAILLSTLLDALDAADGTLRPGRRHRRAGRRRGDDRGAAARDPPAVLRLPVVAAPMFLVTGPELVIAAARSGIVGAFPTPNCRTAEELDGWMARIAAGCAARRPWAANLVTHSTNPRLADDLALVAKHQPPIVITALGSPAPVLDTVHGYGGIVLADVVSEKLGRKAPAAGADGLARSPRRGRAYRQPVAVRFLSAVRSFFAASSRRRRHLRRGGSRRGDRGGRRPGVHGNALHRRRGKPRQRRLQGECSPPAQATWSSAPRSPAPPRHGSSHR